MSVSLPPPRAAKRVGLIVRAGISQFLFEFSTLMCRSCSILGKCVVHLKWKSGTPIVPHIEKTLSLIFSIADPILRE